MNRVVSRRGSASNQTKAHFKDGAKELCPTGTFLKIARRLNAGGW